VKNAETHKTEVELTANLGRLASALKSTAEESNSEKLASAYLAPNPV
jgi:hypothetical protein